MSQTKPWSGCELPFWPLATDNMLADYLHLSAEEMGAHFLLRLVMWRHDGELDDKPDELARIGRVSRERWSAIEANVTRGWVRLGGRIHDPKLLAELAAARKRHLKGKAAAQKRWMNSGNAGAKLST